MKLNIDCVRDVLLCLEDLLQFGENLEYPSIRYELLMLDDRCKKYDEKEIAYTLVKLEEANFISATFISGGGQIAAIIISSITFWGHEFLENIREETVYEEVKTKASKVGSFALDIIKQIAISVISNKINGI